MTNSKLQQLIETIIYEKMQHEKSKIGSNHWVGNFSYLLNEEIQKQYYQIPKNIKSFEEFLIFVDDNYPVE